MAISEVVGKTAKLRWKEALAIGLAGPIVLPAIGAIAAFYPAGAPLLMFGEGAPHSFDSVLLFAALVISVGIPLVGAVIALAWSSSRALRLSAAFLVGTIAGLVPGIGLRGYLEGQAYALLASRSATLVGAIERYEKVHGVFPEQLAELVPSQVPALPSTGIPVSPTYMYARSSGPCAPSNTWHLWIPLEANISYERRMIYCPEQDHNLRPIERAFSYTEFSAIGNWVYASTDLDD